MSKDRSDFLEGDEAAYGFTRVKADEKQGMVNSVFSRVAERYDLMNDVMSGGMHRVWKTDFVNWMAPPKAERPFRLLDVAGGTGDIAFKVLEASGSQAVATVCDISPEMLAVGEKRAANRAYADRVSFVEGNAEALQFEDNSFDVYSIAFGIRNVTHIDKALEEAHRVLKIGGRFMCLEFSDVQTPVIDKLYDVFSFEAIPRLGGIIAGDPEPYQYLVESIRKFPDQDTFAQMIRSAGFEQVSYRNLTGGIAAMHSGWKL